MQPKSPVQLARAEPRKGRGGKRIGRTDVPAGAPQSASWTEEDWALDDRAWYVVAHHPDGLSHRQIGALMGYSKSLVEQIESRACRKLRALARTVPNGDRADISPEWLAVILQRFDAHRADDRFAALVAAELEESGERLLTPEAGARGENSEEIAK